MAGHSKWANIKHRKSAQDARRGKIFTRLIREITISSRLGGADPSSNPRLRTAIDKALDSNMTRDTIDRAIKRGAGSDDNDALEEVRYEGYGPSGVAVIVDCLTDNRNRTVSEVRHAFTKHGGNLGTDGSVSYMFSKLGQIVFAPGIDENKVLEAALEAGAQDVVTQSDQSIEVLTPFEDFQNVLDGLKKAGLNPDNAEVTMVPSTWIELSGESAESVTKLIDVLEDLDDVQEVYSNAEMSE